SGHAAEHTSAHHEAALPLHPCLPGGGGRRAMRATRWKLGIAATSLAVALAGCEPERSRWDVVLQPDGSGRVRLIHETAGDIEVHPGEEPGASDGEAGELAELQAARFLSTIGGVSAWTDVH